MFICLKLLKKHNVILIFHTKIGLFITCSILRFFRWETFCIRNILSWVTQLNKVSLAELKSIVDVCDLDKGNKERKKLL